MGPRTVHRRTVLRWGALASATPAVAAALGPLTACAEGDPQTRDAGTPARAGGAPPSAPRPFELDEVTVADLQRRMAGGETSARDVVRAYLERIEELDRTGPALRSVLETNPDAERIAASLDEERRAGRVRGPLHGIPVLLKDNVDTGDRMTTTAGSLALAGSAAPRDSHVAARLRAAGAVLLGKANMSEWANIRSTQSSSAWSSRGGQGRNPYALDRSPCGSSSGSGTAVAANLAPLAVGTETDGSIVCPSSSQSLIGIKPTLGLVSRRGIVPIAHSQDTAGPMARTVTDAAVLLGALAGDDPRDPATAAARGKPVLDYAAGLDPAALRGARLGVAREGFFGYSEETDRLIEAALEELRRLGAVLVDPADLATSGDLASSPAELEVLLYELKADLNAYLAARGGGVTVRTLAEVIEFNERNAGAVMPWFGQDLFVRAQEMGPLTERAYLDARAESLRLARDDGLDATFREHRLDAILAPTMAPPFKIDLVNGDHFLGGSSTPAAVAGWPAVTVPAGYVSGLPVGLTLVGRPWSEPALIRFAYAFEQATRARRPPTFAPTADPDGAPGAAASEAAGVDRAPAADPASGARDTLPPTL